MNTPYFTPNYPFHNEHRLLSIPERLGADLPYAGRGVVIAFIDSGFYPHPDLGDRIVAHVDATRYPITEGYIHPGDLAWHGQMTSVVAAGDGKLSGGVYRGLAHQAQVVLIKISNTRGHIKEADILRGLRWLAKHHERFNVKIVNVSVGGDYPSRNPDHPIHKVLRKLIDAGLTIFAAAGNGGVPILFPPANSPDVITVGGFNDQNSRDPLHWISYPNNWGTAYNNTRKPDIIAPARWIPSPILPNSSTAQEAYWLARLMQAESLDMVNRLIQEGYTDLSFDRKVASVPDGMLYAQIQERIHAHKLIDAYYQHVDGTSVSVAIAASLGAMLLEANPGLTPKNIKAILGATAKRLSGVPTERQGYGAIDPGLAVSAAQFAAQVLKGPS
jgi:serine protease AprX